MARSGRGRAPRDRKRPYAFPLRVPEPPCTPRPPRVPPRPTPPGPGDHLWPDPLRHLEKVLDPKKQQKKKR